jgi:hypothetical protein
MLFGSGKDRIARELVLRFVLAQICAEIWWRSYELLHRNLHEDQWAAGSCVL